MKKLLAVLLSLAVLFAFAGCGSETPGETAAPTHETEAPTPVGSVIATMGTVGFELVYDREGVILELKGFNEAGDAIAEACQKYVGRACVHGIRGILRYAADNQLLGDAKTFSIRVRHGDPLPEETFLETIVVDTQYLADEECTGIRMIQLDGSHLTAEGYIDEDTAARMGSLYLQVDVTDVTVSQLSAEHTYTVTAADMTCTVGAVTGFVSK